MPPDPCPGSSDHHTSCGLSSCFQGLCATRFCRLFCPPRGHLGNLLTLSLTTLSVFLIKDRDLLQERQVLIAELLTLLREEDRNELRAIFDAFDHNSDGLLDVDEVGAVLQSFGKPMTEAEVSGASGIGADEHAL